MKLLIEDAQEIRYLTEELNGNKHMFFEGIFMQAEVKNKNGRKYPRHIMENEVKRYITERVDAKCAYGELGHPSSPQINHERVTHRIVSLQMEGNDVVGKAIIIPAGLGLIVEGIIVTGGTYGVSSRALGSLKKRGDYQEVQEDFKLSTAADIVDDASAPGARSVRALMENTEWFLDAFGQWQCKQELIEDTVRETKKLTQRQIDERAVTIFDNFLTKLLIR